MGDYYNTWTTATWTTNNINSFTIPNYDIEVKDNGDVWIRYGGTYTNIGVIPIAEPEPKIEELEMAGLPDIFDF